MINIYQLANFNFYNIVLPESTLKRLQLGARIIQSSKAINGFTLIEIIVTVALISIMLASVQLTLPDTRLQNQEHGLKRWQQQADKALVSSLYRGKPFAWEINANTAKLLQRDSQDGSSWVPLTKDNIADSEVLLTEDLTVKNFVINGHQAKFGDKIIFSGGQSPVFNVYLVADDKQWRISGDPAGHIILEAKRNENWVEIE